VVRGPWKQQKPSATEAVIDVDMPFNPEEVARATSERYVEHLTRSDMTVVESKPPEAAAEYCELGRRNCKRFKAKGVCKQPECPIVASERKKVARATVASPLVLDPIDVDMPFSASELAAATSPTYVAALGRSDLPNLGRWQTARGSGRRVLVVDDEVVVVNSIRKSLLRRGHTVDEAFNGKEALARILSQHYDLVLLDMRMPDLNGLELLPKIKSHRPNLPVVIVTGYASIDTAVEAVRRGASDYLGKPFSPEELYDVTGRVLKAAAA
jgi:CheY-like chemotaxis protein